jgi:nitrogen fixation-related uncharacterized protein
MIDPNRISDLLRPIVVVLGAIFIIVMLWGWISNDDYEDDEFTVTITYNCDRVITGRDYPNEVLSQCLDLRNDIKRRNN